MNGFDFDGTLYDGDSSLDFILFALRKQPSCLTNLPRMLAAGIKRAVGRIDTTAFKQTAFGFLAKVPEVEPLLQSFWDTHLQRLNDDVVARFQKGDVIISASPEFLLRMPADQLGAQLFGTKMDPATGQISGKNCKRDEKVERLREAGIDPHFDEFYTDSDADAPLVSLAAHAFLVGKGGRIEEISKE